MHIIVVLMLIATLEGSMALSEGEKTAVSDLLKEWPFLGSVSPAWTSNSSEACAVPFKGIICSDGPDQHIISLDLAADKQSGELPETIGGLFELQTLNLVMQELKGRLPSSVGNLTKLQDMKVAIRSNWNRCLPATLSNLENLARLEFLISGYLGDFPPAILKLRKLNHLTLGRFPGFKLSFYGSIPSSFCDLEQLTGLELNGVALSGFEICAGKLPNLEVLSFNLAPNMILPLHTLLVGRPKIKILTLSVTHVYGPLELQGQVALEQLAISGNDISGTLPEALTENQNLVSILVQNCKVGGTLPTSIGKLHLLESTIPDHYRTTNFGSISLTDNQLEGDISPILTKYVNTAKLGYNRFNGSIPNSIISSAIQELSISNNFLTGTIPPLPSQLTRLSAAGNYFHGTLDNIFKNGSPNQSLEYLDLSHNLLEGPPPSVSSFGSFTFVSLASNNLTGYIDEFNSPGTLEKLRVLDLSNNRLYGNFPFLSTYLSISNLILANNSFSGTIPDLSNFQQLSILDISNNQFSSDASSFKSYPYISLISAQNNSIYGTLSLIGLQSLTNADFSHNKITKLDFDSIHKLSQSASLSSISIKNNPINESIDAFRELTGDGTLSLSSTTTPSIEYQGVICSELWIGNNDKTRFEYDESMFSFQQCQCDRDHFGLPPFNCLSCDNLKPGATLCNGNTVHVGQNYYVYNDSKDIRTEICVSQYLYAAELKQGRIRMSNCLGLEIEYEGNRINVITAEGRAESASTFPSPSQLALQCHIGSSGRLCTRCDCDVTSADRTCYYPGPAGICQKCEKVFSPNAFIPISLVVFIVVLIALTIIFHFILASKRQPKELEWKYLSIGKRILYRLVDLTSFGQITILVTFVQILVELTHWDAYILSAWLKVVNGESEGLGLRCLYPFLSNPTKLLVLRLLLPILAIAIAGMSIGLAEFLHRFRAYLKRRASESVLDSETKPNNDLSSQSTLMINDEEDEGKSVPFPSMALATSTSISILKFFYFGTAMAAVEYLFYSVQNGTNKKYVHSIPWMSFEDASTLRAISIPFLVVYMFGVPFGFVGTSWKLRHKISSPFVRLYFGSLFENYQIRLFWWELVNILRKLIVALLLRGLSPDDSFQPLFITLLLGSIGVINATLKPWRRGIENFLDGIGSALPILSMASNLLGSLNHSSQTSIIILVLDSVYIAFCVLVIGWRTIRSETSYEKEWKLKYGSESYDSIKPASEDYGPPLLSNDGALNILDSE